jgi:hypothetical protein
VRDHAAHRRSQQGRHLRASSHRRTQDMGRAGHRRTIRATVDVTGEPLTETSSRLTITVGFDGHGIGKLLVPLIVRRQAQKGMPANVEALKRRVEAQ